MYKDIILHGLKVRVFGNGKSIQVFRNKSWVPLKFKESYGYPLVTLKHKSLRKHYKVSRLVAMAYIPNPNNLPVVMHLNNIRTDNRAENLKWGTQKENTQHLEASKFYILNPGIMFTFSDIFQVVVIVMGFFLKTYIMISFALFVPLSKEHDD